MGMMWIYVVFILLLCEAWSREPDDIRYLDFNESSDANLTCIDKTWNETIYIIWKIKSKVSECKISLSEQGKSEDTCNDGKSLRNTSSSQSYLHIPNFSADNVGEYNCEFAYKGGNENILINVDIRVPPHISAWLEVNDNKTVAVCKAEGGKPAANISWSHTGNVSQEQEGSTIESRLELSEGVDAGSLRCVISHPYWKEDQHLVPTPKQQKQKKQGNALLACIFIAVVIVVLFTGFVFFAQKKQIFRRFQQSNPSESKSAPVEDVEEVEPYASYVQRVNSIYNSSADLFT
ncbi:uncharacterized protein V6R79_013511 [Siganus canaliculatus]